MARRTKEQIHQLNQQILDELEDTHPQSLRHVFYRMTDPRLPEPVEKSESGYRTIMKRLTALRRDGRVPYGWIVDETRAGSYVRANDSVTEYLLGVVDYYQFDPWRDVDHYVQVWCESRSIAGVIRDLCDEFRVALYPAGGFASLTLVHDGAKAIDAGTGYGQRPAEVIYAGDYDPAGVLIDQDIEEKLRGHLPNVDLNFHRIAVNEDQITKYGLPSKPVKKGETRSPHIQAAVEAEAMPVGVLLSILRDKLTEYLPEELLAETIAADQAEIDQMRILLTDITKEDFRL